MALRSIIQILKTFKLREIRNYYELNTNCFFEVDEDANKNIFVREVKLIQDSQVKFKYLSFKLPEAIFY